MKQSQVITALTLCLLLAQTTCVRLEKIQTARISSAGLNPYRGAVKDLLQKQVGEYKLVNTSGLEEMAQEVNNPFDVVGAIYNSPGNQAIQHMVSSFRSAAEANRELDEALKRYKDSHVTVGIEDVQDENGQVSGRRIVVNDLNAEALNWTNGSLYCTAVAYTGHATAFAKRLPY